MNFLKYTSMIAVCLFSFVVNAQEDTTATESTAQVEAPAAKKSSNENIEKLEVTGSHIKRIDIEGPSPILVLDREYLDKTGYNSVADVLRDTTVAGLGGTREAGLTGGAGTGAATTSVRGMDADSVLVLLDGKRMPTIGGSTTVDLNLIPMAAIERVEVLKDGASAIYGSDALGGVINFITKKDYDGASISMNYALPEAKGGAKTDVTATYGKTGSTYDILAVVNYRSNESVGMRDRDFFIPPPEAFSGSGSPGSWKEIATSSSSWTAGGGGAPCTGTVLSNGKCAFDYSPYMNVMPELEQYSALLNGSFRIGEGMRVFNRIVFTHRDVKSQLAPPPDSFTDETDIEGLNTEIPVATATAWGLPATTDIDVVYRLVEEVGPRVNQTKSDSTGITSGVKGQLWDSWDWEFSGNYAQTRTTNRGISGYANKQILYNLATQSPTGFNPFAASGSKSNIDSAKYVPQLIIDSNIGSALLSATGEVMDMPAGPLAVAVGTSANWQTFAQSADTVTASGAQWGGGTSAEGEGNRDFQSAYVEFSLPPFTGMEVQVAGRFDNYSDFGSAINPKVGFRYNPMKWLMLRGSWGTGFKAPALDDLYGGQTVGFPFGTDPVTTTSAQYKTIGGGNRNLKEETSESINFGFIAQIMDNLSFGTDYYINNQKDVVSSGSLRDIFSAEEQFGAAYLAGFGIQVIRNPAVTGAIDKIIAPQMNLATRDTEGLEFKVTHNMHLFGNWKMVTIVDHSVILTLDEEAFPGLGKEKRAGFAGNPYWRNNVNVNFGNGTYGLSLLAKTIGEQNFSALSPGDGGKTRDHTELDIQTQYMSSWNGLFALGVRNAFNTDRPLLAEHLANGFLNTSLYDPFGRTVFLGYTQNF